VENLIKITIAIFREEATSALAGFHAGSLSWSNWNLEMLVFVEGRKPEKPEKNPEGEPTTDSTHIWHRAGIEPGLHWWEASAPTTAPSRLPIKSCHKRLTFHFHRWSRGVWLEMLPNMHNGQGLAWRHCECTVHIHDTTDK